MPRRASFEDQAGSILLFGSEIESTRDEQKIVKLRIYPGADADFTLYSDDGVSYAYEKGEYKTTKLHWDDANGKLTHEGAEAWRGSDEGLMDVVWR